MKSSLKTIAPAALAIGLAFGTTASAQSNEERLQNTQNIIECVNDNINAGVDSAFNALAADPSLDGNDVLGAEIVNTILDCVSPVTIGDFGIDHLDYTASPSERFNAFGTILNMVDESSDLASFIDQMDEDVVPEAYEYIEAKKAELGL